MSTFNFSPDYSASKALKQRIIKHQFGDGYEVRRSSGLNSRLKEWSLTFRRDKDTVTAIDTFLTSRGGVESFNWTDPNGYAAVWVCEEHSEVFDEIDWHTITCTFREVPETALP